MSAHTPGPAIPMQGEGWIIFPDFWMFKNESGWRWVNREGTRSSPAAFEFAHVCMLDARRTLDKIVESKSTYSVPREE